MSDTAGTETADRRALVCAELKSRLPRIAALPGVRKVILYGSYAKCTDEPESDVDLAVFFDGCGRCLLEEYRQLVRICVSPVVDIQVQAFAADELDEPCGIIEEIVTFGTELPIACGDWIN